MVLHRNTCMTVSIIKCLPLCPESNSILYYLNISDVIYFLNFLSFIINPNFPLLKYLYV